MSIENVRDQEPLFGLPFAKVKSLVIQNPIFGAEPEDGDGDGSDGSGGNNGSDTDGDPAGSGDGGTGKPEVKKDDDKSAAELANYKKQLEEKDAEIKKYKEAEEAEARKKRTDDENNAKDLEDARQKIKEMDEDGEALLDTIHNLVLENAIALGNVKWHDVSYVLQEIDPDAIEVTVDKDTRRGAVTGLEKELERIAKEKPFLVKAAEVEEVETSRVTRRRGSGAPPGSGNGAGNDKAKSRERLIGLYPSIAH